MTKIFEARDQFFNNSFPFPYLVIDGLLDSGRAEAIAESFWEYEDDRWEKFGQPFYNDNGQKKQMYDLSRMPEPIAEFFQSFMKNDFVENFSNHTGLDIKKADIFGAGMNIYAPGSELKKHADFNFNDQIKMYRCMNFLYYVNDWQEGDGGCLQLYDPKSDKVVEIAPKNNRVVIFPTNLGTPHGVSRSATGFFRKSLGIYYYTESPPSNVSDKPHRTIWKEND